MPATSDAVSHPAESQGAKAPRQDHALGITERADVVRKFLIAHSETQPLAKLGRIVLSRMVAAMPMTPTRTRLARSL